MAKATRVLGAKDWNHIPVKGPVLLRLTLTGGIMPVCKHIKKPKSEFFVGSKTMEYWAQSPTEQQIHDWAAWAAPKLLRGTTHTFPELYSVYRITHPYYGKKVTVIDVQNGS